MAKGAFRILVPVTGHRVDEEAVEIACDLAKRDHGQVSVLYVIRVARALPLDADIPAETAIGEDLLQRMERIGRLHKCHVEGEILQARDLGPAIVQEAVEREARMIVIGLPYTERYGAPTLGEVVPYLLKYSPCRVLITREQPAPVTQSTGQSV